MFKPPGPSLQLVSISRWFCKYDFNSITSAHRTIHRCTIFTIDDKKTHAKFNQCHLNYLPKVQYRARNQSKRTISNTGSFCRHSNHYQTLGLKQSATLEEIKSAYFKLSKKFHPDSFQSNYSESDVEVFLKISEAFEILNNKRTKSEYDLAEFGRSSDVNRFSSGEYELYSRRASPNIASDDIEKNIEVTNRMRRQAHRKAYSNMHGQKAESLFSLSPKMAGLLHKLYAVIIICGVSIYCLGKYNQSKNSEENSDEV